jgi:hypothetical protein
VFFVVEKFMGSCNRANRFVAFYFIGCVGIAWWVCEKIIGTEFPSILWGLFASIAAMIAGSLAVPQKET